MGKIAYELEGKIAYLTIQSPPANALSSYLIKDINEKLNKIESENIAKVIVLKGEGKFFSAGADIKEITALQNSSDYESLSNQGQQVFDRIESLSIPVIASIHGAALGGGLELAMACHIRIVAEKAKLGLPEMSLGIIPGFAGTQRLPGYVGTAKAYEMILSGEPISGPEAVKWGLANKTVPEVDLIAETTKLAEKIAAKSKPAINHIMRLIPFAKTELFSKGVREEAKAFGTMFGSQDAKEGVQAFLEKREPNFQDK
ncbi:enoyl-CoA hydratase [Oceanobacillus rekensis]|uniref:enoyl-CoA hydratase n=1 Tax=Oceanobacillus rekensis TaxID=937927 RepID=UPI000B42F09B|nr:enoyl-CoA hydratase [Oceanobacillus rekensis]